MDEYQGCQVGVFTQNWVFEVVPVGDFGFRRWADFRFCPQDPESLHVQDLKPPIWGQTSQFGGKTSTPFGNRDEYWKNEITASR